MDMRMFKRTCVKRGGAGTKRWSLKCTVLVSLISVCLSAWGDGELSPANEQGQYRYLIEFEEPGLLERHAIRIDGERTDLQSPQMRAEARDLIAQQEIHHQTMADELGRTLESSHYYLITHSGMAVWLEPDEAEQVRLLPGVVSIDRERIYRLSTYRGPAFIGADSVWNGSAVPGGNELRGEGMIIGVLDTGIPAEHGAHASFANDPTCGHGEGGVPNKVLSSVDCGSTGTNGLCSGTNPGDTNGHGTHVASTAAGNQIGSSANPSPDIPGSYSEMSGVAPCAHIRSYKVCPDDGCPGSAIQAGLNHVLADGDVDVMNFSISGGRNPWSDNDRRKLDLVNAGILVAAAAGNTSQLVRNPVGQVNHIGPWVMTVAASTRDTNNAGNSAKGDVLANFSLRGPTPEPFDDLQKPDITAPGVNIYAAYVHRANPLNPPCEHVNYCFSSGTSMASPHAAGAAALVRQARPSWTPSEVKSALMMTSSKAGTKENGSTRWDADDIGSGRVDLSDAAMAGLVMNETTANYMAANPDSGGDVKTLNIPALRDLDCSPSCSWTRTVRNTLNAPSTWAVEGNIISPGEGFEITIDPAEFSFDGGPSQSQSLVITATPNSDLLGAGIGFGEVVLKENSGNSPDLHLTVAISGEGAEGPAPVACDAGEP